MAEPGPRRIREDGWCCHCHYIGRVLVGGGRPMLCGTCDAEDRAGLVTSAEGSPPGAQDAGSEQQEAGCDTGRGD